MEGGIETRQTNNNRSNDSKCHTQLATQWAMSDKKVASNAEAESIRGALAPWKEHLVACKRYVERLEQLIKTQEAKTPIVTPRPAMPPVQHTASVDRVVQPKIRYSPPVYGRIAEVIMGQYPNVGVAEAHPLHAWFELRPPFEANEVSARPHKNLGESKLNLEPDFPNSTPSVGSIEIWTPTPTPTA